MIFFNSQQCANKKLLAETSQLYLKVYHCDCISVQNEAVGSKLRERPSFQAEMPEGGLLVPWNLDIYPPGKLVLCPCVILP